MDGMYHCYLCVFRKSDGCCFFFYYKDSVFIGKIPNNLCAKIEGRDTSLLVNQSEFATMIIWYDTIQCASCSMNSVNIWKTFFEYSFDSIEGFNPIIIFSPNKRLLRDFEVSLKVTKFKYPVLVDYDNIF